MLACTQGGDGDAPGVGVRPRRRRPHRERRLPRPNLRHLDGDRALGLHGGLMGCSARGVCAARGGERRATVVVVMPDTSW